MKKLMNLVHRFASKVLSNVIAFAYNPKQEEIVQLLRNMYEINIFVIQS